MEQRQTILKEDLSIKCEVSDEDLQAYAVQLGIDQEKEPHLLWIAREGLEAPIPAPWCPVEDGEGRIYYFNKETQESSWEHPADAYYKRLVTLEKQRQSTRPHSTSIVQGTSDSELTSASGFLSKRSLLPKLPSGGSQLSSLDDIPPLASSTIRSLTKEEVGGSIDQSPSKKEFLASDQLTTKNKSLFDLQSSRSTSNRLKKSNVLSQRSVKFDLGDEEDDIAEDLPLSSDESEGLLYPFHNVMDPATLLGKKDSSISQQAKEPLLHISAQSLSPPSELLILDSRDVRSPIKTKLETYSSEPKPGAGTLSELTLSGASKTKDIPPLLPSSKQQDLSEPSLSAMDEVDQGRGKNGPQLEAARTEELRLERERLENQLRDGLEKERSSLDSEFDRLRQDLKDSHLKDIAALKEQLQEDHLKNVAALKEKLFAQHSKEIQELKKQLNLEYEKETRKIKETLLEKHQLNIEELEQELGTEHLKNLTNVKETLEASHLEEIEQLKEKLQLLQSKSMNQLEEEHRLRKNSSLQKMQSLQDQELSVLKHKMEEELEEKKRQTLDQMEKEFQAWKLQMEQEFSDMKESAMMLREEQRLRQLQEAVAREQDLLSQLKSRRIGLQEQVDKLQQELDAGHASLSGLHAEIASVQRDVDRLESKVRLPDTRSVTFAEPPRVQTSRPPLDNDNANLPKPQTPPGFELLIGKIDALEKQFSTLETRMTKEDTRWQPPSDCCPRHQGELNYYRQQLLDLQMQNRQSSGFPPFPGQSSLEPASWYRPQPRPVWHSPVNSTPLGPATSLNSLIKEENTTKDSFSSSSQTFEKKLHQYSSQLLNTEKDNQASSNKYESMLHLTPRGDALKDWQQQLSVLYRRMQDHQHFLQLHHP